tara:strand:- start:1042 stop:2031 length:990 start_codon:yes stop_codon:yes gene_type:complete
MSFRKLKYLQYKFLILYSSTISSIQIFEDDHLSSRELIIEIIRHNQSKALLSIYISNYSNIPNNDLKRILSCLKFWIPYSIDLFAIVTQTIKLKFVTCDSGSTKYLSMDSCNTDTLIPDEYCMNISQTIRKINPQKKFNQFYNNWINRKSTMFWRGSTTGQIINNIEDLIALKRVQICLTSLKYRGFDLKITRVVQNNIPNKAILRFLKTNSIYSQSVSENYFRRFKYYPDIPGNSLAWGTINKYLLGNLIFRPNTNRSLHYYRFLTPWINYIPVREDFTDLYDQYNWAQSHPCHAAWIAWNGHLMAREYLINTRQHFLNTAKSYINTF